MDHARHIYSCIGRAAPARVCRCGASRTYLQVSGRRDQNSDCRWHQARSAGCRICETIVSHRQTSNIPIIGAGRPAESGGQRQGRSASIIAPCNTGDGYLLSGSRSGPDHHISVEPPHDASDTPAAKLSPLRRVTVVRPLVKVAVPYQEARFGVTICHVVAPYICRTSSNEGGTSGYWPQTPLSDSPLSLAKFCDFRVLACMVASAPEPLTSSTVKGPCESPLL